jgi:1-acyl-sn-glycerol-3-phosphate acyltransferase
VVFPDAGVKVFLVADVTTRAKRRQAEDAARGVQHDLGALVADLERRDRADSTRSASPLEQAADAVRLDTSALTPADQVDAVLTLALRRVRNERLTGISAVPTGRVRVLEVDVQESAQPGYRPFHSSVYWFFHTAIRVLGRLVFGLKIHSHPAARLRGSVLVASNHISGLDPPLVGSCVPFETWFLAKLELFHNPLLGALIHRFNGIPIRRGTADFETLDRAVAELRRTHNVFMFPEGTRHKPGALGDPRWGFGYVALAAGRPIVPLFVRGTKDGRPRGLRREPMEVWIGAPFRLEAVETADHAAYKEAARLVMERIAGLMLRSAAAHPLRGLELPGPWAGARAERTETNTGGAPA